MQSHGTGPQRGSRISGISFIHTIPIDFSNNASATNYKVLTIKGSLKKPVFVRLYVVVVVADNSATSSVVSVGDAAAGAGFFSAVDLKASAGSNYFYGSNGNLYPIIVDTNFWVRVTRVGTPTAGRSYLIVEGVEGNSTRVGRAT